jgi:hypothetical protein
MSQQQEQQVTQVTTFPQALQLLVDGVQVAQKRGAYSLEEAAMLLQGMNFLKQQAKEAASTPAASTPAASTPAKLEKIEEM